MIDKQAIDFVVAQVGCSKQNARERLQRFGGDLESTLLSFLFSKIYPLSKTTDWMKN